MTVVWLDLANADEAVSHIYASTSTMYKLEGGKDRFKIFLGSVHVLFKNSNIGMATA